MAESGASLSGITKRYSRRSPWVLEGIDLDLQPGSRTVVIGGNGSGKSTLLRIGAGVSRPNQGTVELPARIAYVPERLAVRARFTGTEYLTHMGRIKGVPARVTNARSRQLARRLNLQPGLDEPIDTLSKGNRQKLVLAQAFLAPAGLLVLDEPFGGLDPVARAALDELMHEAQTAGSAVLLSSHGSVPEEIGSRQLRILDGRLSAVGRDDNPVTTTTVMEVHLSGSDRRSDPQQLAGIPGVRHLRLEHAGAVVVRTDGLHTDRFLVEAIALGWSVRSVCHVPPEVGPS